jgi:hypothetical protein
MIPLARLASKLPARQLNATGREVVSQTNEFLGRISRENFTVTRAVGNVVDVNSMSAPTE